MEKKEWTKPEIREIEVEKTAGSYSSKYTDPDYDDENPQVILLSWGYDPLS